jgi:hypothetical protein
LALGDFIFLILQLKRIGAAAIFDPDIDVEARNCRLITEKPDVGHRCGKLLKLEMHYFSLPELLDLTQW